MALKITKEEGASLRALVAELVAQELAPIKKELEGLDERVNKRVEAEMQRIKDTRGWRKVEYKG